MKDITLLIIKPNAVKKHVIGDIIRKLENNKFEVLAIKSFFMTELVADDFYEMHKGKSFFQRLINFMTTGLSIALILKKENAVIELRNFIGSTDPQLAKEGSIRSLYGDDITRNAVHASDSNENVAREIPILFSDKELKNNKIKLT
jgi:nucleoside-diphosphate kinase